MRRIAFWMVLVLGFIACNKDELIIDENGEIGNSTLPIRVYEYCPAPGQFIHEVEASTMAEACRAAEDRFKRGTYVSLGAWGGYIVMGIGKSITNSGSYDFAIRGNATDTSSEPGIVSVMTDTNGDGLPNDTWYELAGSDYHATSTWHNYSVTYHRPAEGEKSVNWEDNHGQSGTISLKPTFPAWISGESCTFTGTRLEARNHDDSGNGTYWVNDPYDWGYADNYSKTDRLYQDARNCFRISDAVDGNGKSVRLEKIDFIRVQTGVLAESGWLGELSTEVFAISLCH